MLLKDLATHMSEDSEKSLISSADGEPHSEGRVERRKAPRRPVTAAAEVVDLRSQARITGRCADLGSGGCYIDTISPFAVGTAVGVRIERELHEFEATAVVSYALSSMGMGLSFSDIKPEHLTVLRSWISESGSESSEKHGSQASASEESLLAAITSNRLVIREFINLMVRKKLMSENEAAGLLRQISR